MAQGAVAVAATNGIGVGNSLPAELTERERREILEYEKIIAFKDAVLAGTHPRVKIPAHILSKQLNAFARVSSPAHLEIPPDPSVQSTSSTSSAKAGQNSNSLDHKVTSNQRLFPMSANSEINPILLEKSDDLIKAEIQLQRHRLERGLREQIEQQRIASRTLLQTSESLPTFDFSEVLAKVSAIAQAAAPPAVEGPPSVGAPSNSSDSFDENTFYSSQHDTLSASGSSQGLKEPGELASQIDHPPPQTSLTKSQIGSQDLEMTDNSSLSNHQNHPHQGKLLAQYIPAQHKSFYSKHSTDSSDSASIGGGNASEDVPSTAANAHRQIEGGPAQTNVPSHITVSTMHGPERTLVQKTNDELLKQAFESSNPPPHIGAHNLSPLAPQPTRVSPLVTAREPPVPQTNRPGDAPTPAQVAALRARPLGLSSTDSSPKGQRKEKKKREKKKRKGKENEATSPDSPYIKPEPRSPSPFTVPRLPRPTKRQRQAAHYESALNYDEPRPEVVEELPRRIREVGDSREYGRYEERQSAEWPRMDATYRRADREIDSRRHVSGPQYIRQPGSPLTGHTASYQTTAPQIVGERRVLEEPRYYRESGPRTSVRLDSDRERSRSPIIRNRRSPLLMAPPRRAVRMIVDEYGNEFIDPSSVAPTRQSMAPPTRYREPETIYDSTSVRMLPSRDPNEFEKDGIIYIEKDGVMYRRASPVAPRRVVTQPDHSLPNPEYRSYRQREYSVRPTAMAPPGDEHTQMRAPDQRSGTYHDDSSREYSRATSIRPEPARNQAPREYLSRHQSVRPEGSTREYAANIQLDGRPEMVLQPQRQYSVRPEEQVREYVPSAYSETRRNVTHEPHRAYSVRPEGFVREYVQPDSRRETIQQPLRHHSVRPEGLSREYVYGGPPDTRMDIDPPPPRAYSVMPQRVPTRVHEEPYYDVGRGPADVAFIERPRARESSVIVYTDDVRREVYR